MLTPKQLEARKKGLGGSDAAVIAGLSTYMTPLELYLIKRGEVPLPDLSDNQAVEWGIRLEEMVAAKYADQTGRKVRKVNQTLYHPELDWMLANLDRDIVGGERILEVKTAGRSSGWGQEGTDEVPETCLLQCEHYLGVTGRQVADVAVLIGGQDFRIYEIPRDEELISSLIEMEREFWQRVKNGTPPEPTFDHSSTANLFQRMYPGTNGQTLGLPDDAYHWHKTLVEAKKQVKLYEAVADGAKAHLQHLMGEAAVGRLNDGSAYTRKLTKRKGYEVEPCEFIDFRYKRGGK